LRLPFWFRPNDDPGDIPIGWLNHITAEVAAIHLCLFAFAIDDAALQFLCQQEVCDFCQQKVCDFRVGKNKSAIGGTIVGWLYLPPVQHRTHDNW
jgi:hypothetical protein